VIEDVIEKIRDHLEEHPRTSLTRLSLQTGVSRSACHKIVKKNLHLHPYKVTTVQELLRNDPESCINYFNWFQNNLLA
jgi:Asp-tRNA(Asn)/Glu-tRNA(Gln) amidotransferase B subunit